MFQKIKFCLTSPPLLGDFNTWTSSSKLRCLRASERSSERSSGSELERRVMHQTHGRTLV